jgi:hypothetical protein
MVTLITSDVTSTVGATITPPALLLGGADLDALDATHSQFKFHGDRSRDGCEPVRTLCRRLTTNANFEARKNGLDDFTRHS